jgi:hypothetical protein
MGHFKDILPSQKGWIHELAKAEIHPDAERLLQLGKSFDPQQLIEESTIDFLTGLRDSFSEYVRLFNSYSETGSKFQEIKLYSIAQTSADFMIFRNQIKLLVSNTAHGIIQISFSQHVRGTMDVNGQVVNGASSGLSANAQPQDLHAQIGPFREVYWTFQNEKIEAAQVAKFYFTEFARLTRDNKRSKGGNQLLLDQIKALLQEKGLDL